MSNRNDQESSSVRIPAELEDEIRREILAQTRPLLMIKRLHEQPKCRCQRQWKIEMNSEKIEIIDCGRGPQLSTSRLTVLDVFYYLHRGHEFEFIHQALPRLSRTEFDVVLDYVNKHRDELVEEDRRTDDFIQRGIAEQKAKGLYPALDETIPFRERLARLSQLMHQRQSRRTVTTLLVDANLDGHADLIHHRLLIAHWREFYEHLAVRFLKLEDVGLDRTTSDIVIWRLCQKQRCFLLTANRNHDSDESLEATIRREGNAESIPVLTLSDAPRIYHSAEYLDRVVERLLDYLLNREIYRGAGRLFHP
jgi:hypothetical protein